MAERGYRAVMAENERLCNKLEHLEEIFVHQAGKSGFGKPSNDDKRDSSSSGKGAGGTSKAGDMKLLRHLKAENSAMRVRLQRLESGAPLSPKGGAAGKKSKFVNSSGDSEAVRQQRQDSQELKAQNAQLQKRIEKYRKREMELLRALKAQQLRRTGVGSQGGRSERSSSSGRPVGSPLRQES